MNETCKYCARLELGLKWWFCTKDGHHIKEFDGKTYIPDPNWKGCEENFVRRDKVQYLPELYDALNKQAYYRCVDCLRHTAKTINDIPLNKDMIEHGCPKNRTDCGAFNVWPLLKKVRNGK